MAETLLNIDRLLEETAERGASDLHLTVGSEPAVRVRGRLERLTDYPQLDPETAQTVLYRILSSDQQKHLELKRSIDLAYEVPGVARFRVNIYFQRHALGGAFRQIPQ